LGTIGDKIKKYIIISISLVLFLACDDKDEIIELPDSKCYIVPEVGPCEGLCPTYYYNQNSSKCEEFITGCCGVEAFETSEECVNTCE